MSELTVGNDQNKITFIKKETTDEGNGNLDLMLPDKKFNYKKEDDTDTDTDIYLVASKSEPSSALTDSNFDTAFLSYTKTGGIDWKSNIKSITGFENLYRGTVNLLDENVIVGLGRGPVSDRTTKRGNILNYIKDCEYEWISLHSCVADIGLNQIAWNTNENYNIPKDNTSAKTLIIEVEDENTTDEDLTCKIYYIDNTFSLKYSQDTIQNLNNLSNVFKVNSAEIIGNGVGKGLNRGDIKFSFQETPSSTNGRIVKLELFKKNSNTCFDYNEDYYNDPQFNTFLDITNDNDDSTETGEDTSIKSDISTSNSNIDNEELCNLLSNNKEYELEGGTGRKASVYISSKSGTSFNIKITNSGYLYLKNDELRFKTLGDLRDNYYFKVTSIDTATNVTTNYLQEFIKSGSGKSNTIKRAFTDSELFVAKTLQISGSVEGYVLVRLIKLNNIFTNNISQHTIKEVYYYKRNNINDTFDINTVYEENTELYIDIQKIIRKDDNSNEDDDRSTLNFSLNGILYNSKPSVAS